MSSIVPGHREAVTQQPTDQQATQQQMTSNCPVSAIVFKQNTCVHQMLNGAH